MPIIWHQLALRAPCLPDTPGPQPRCTHLQCHLQCPIRVILRGPLHSFFAGQPCLTVRGPADWPCQCAPAHLQPPPSQYPTCHPATLPACCCPWHQPRFAGAHIRGGPFLPFPVRLCVRAPICSPPFHHCQHECTLPPYPC